jgi:hypothetical protein
MLILLIILMILAIIFIDFILDHFFEVSVVSLFLIMLFLN